MLSRAAQRAEDRMTRIRVIKGDARRFRKFSVGRRFYGYGESADGSAETTTLLTTLITLKSQQAQCEYYHRRIYTVWFGEHNINSYISVI